MSAYKTLDEKQLLVLLNRGDEAAFSEIYDRHWEQMLSYAVRLTKSEEEGADIVQEIFVSIWNRKDVLQIKDTLISYLIKSTRNLSLRYIENNITKNHFLDRLTITMESAIADADQSDKVYLKQLQNHVNGTVAKLPSKMQAVYLLSRNEQLSHKEIAMLLGIAETTVKKQINNALKIISGTMTGQLVVYLSTLSVFLFK